MVDQIGGTLQQGWLIWEWPKAYLEAEFHGVWRDPKGFCLDITPPSGGEERILFVPDNQRHFDFESRVTPSNRYWPLTDDSAVARYIELTADLNRIKKTYHGQPPRP